MWLEKPLQPRGGNHTVTDGIRIIGFSSTHPDSGGGSGFGVDRSALGMNSR